MAHRWVLLLLVLFVVPMGFAIPPPSDLSQVTFLHAPEAKNWPETSTITSTKINNNEICFPHTKAGTWPQYTAPRGPASEGNPWIIANVGGQWYAATYEWLRPGQTCKSLSIGNVGAEYTTLATAIGPHIKQSPLDTWIPQTGETIGLFVSTRARDSGRTSNERSNVVWTTWTASSGSSSGTPTLSCSMPPAPPGCMKFASSQGINSGEPCDDDREECGYSSLGGDFTFTVSEDQGGKFFIAKFSEMEADLRATGWSRDENPRCQSFGSAAYTSGNTPFRTVWEGTSADSGSTVTLPPLSGDTYTLGSYGDAGGNRAYLCPIGFSGGPTNCKTTCGGSQVDCTFMDVGSVPSNMCGASTNVYVTQSLVAAYSDGTLDPAYGVGLSEFEAMNNHLSSSSALDVMYTIFGHVNSPGNMGEINVFDSCSGNFLWQSGDFTAGTGGQQLIKVSGEGFVPDTDDPGEVVYFRREKGVFFTQPQGVTCASSSRDCAAEYWVDFPMKDAYEKIVVTYSVKTNDMRPEGYYQVLARMLHACSEQKFWQQSIRMPTGNSFGLTALDARAYGSGNEWLTGSLNYLEHTTYTFKITYDLADAEVDINVYDQSGNLLQTIGGSLNGNPDNHVNPSDSAGGVSLVFGWYDNIDDMILGQPHAWEFSDLEVKGIPLGGEVDKSGWFTYDFTVDEGKLAFMAGELVSIAQGDYIIDCGPSAEVPNLPPTVGTYYCVMEDEDQIIFATFTETPESDILSGFIDPMYDAQVDASKIDPSACDNIDTTILEFQECPGAIQGMYTYVMYNYEVGASFLFFSEEGVDKFYPSILRRLVVYLRKLFGFETTTHTILPMARFHHGYISEKAGRQIFATWDDNNAVLSYTGFVTDFDKVKPPGSYVRLGAGKQAVFATLNPSSQNDIDTWRSLTAALRITDVPGTPISGGTCGDGVLDFDEACEQDLQMPTCVSLWGTSTQEYPDCVNCQLVKRSCFGIPKDCSDPWVEPPTANPCPGEAACNRNTCEGGTGGTGTCGNGVVDAGEDCNSCPQDTGGPCATGTCPTELLNIPGASVGSYTFSAMRDNQGELILRVNRGASEIVNKECWGPSSAETFTFLEDVDIPYSEGGTRLIYERKKTARCGANDPDCDSEVNRNFHTKIYVSMADGEYTIKGGGAVNTAFGSAGMMCWDCEDKECDETLLQIRANQLPSCIVDGVCDPDVEDGVCPIQCSITNDADCPGFCGNNGDGICPIDCTADSDCYDCANIGDSCGPPFCCQRADGTEPTCDNNVCRLDRCADDGEYCEEDSDCCPGAGCSGTRCVLRV